MPRELFVWAMNKDGKGMSKCYSKPENFGKPPCTHIAHQQPGESIQDFLQRVSYNPARDNPAIRKEWNQIAYEQASQQLDQFGMTCIVQGTGLGKTAVICRIADEHRDRNMLFVTVGTELINDMQDYHFGTFAQKQVDLTTYAGFCRMGEDELRQYDMVFLDEAHHLGDDNVCLKQLKVMQESHPGPGEFLLVGATATPERTNGMNVAEEVFQGHVSSDLSVEQAWDAGYLTVPQVLEFPDVKRMQDQCFEQVQRLAKEGYHVADQVMRAQKALNIPNRDGIIVDSLVDKINRNVHYGEPSKVLVYCRSVDEIGDVRKEVGPLLQQASERCGMRLNEQVFISATGKRRNAEIYQRFAEDDGLQVLYLFDKLNEGSHVHGVNIEIQARPTGSRIGYYQKQGRVLSKNDENPPLLIDLVGNTSQLSDYDHAGKNPNYRQFHVVEARQALRDLRKIGCKWTTRTRNGETVTYEDVYEYYQRQGYSLDSRMKSAVKRLCKDGVTMEDMRYYM